jgi:ubiquinone/menaquinone biosynthesis C-methylase UbiE
MAHRVCPWWIGYFLASPLRKLRQDPNAILSPFVREGMVVLEPGPGMGFFTLELARLVGPTGRVIAVDVQPRMLAALRRRARRRLLQDRVETRLASDGGMPVADLPRSVDFALAFAMVHEVPDPARFFAEVAGSLKPGGKVLLAEPKGHVGEAAFADTLRLAAGQGLQPISRPTIAGSHAAVLAKA